MSFIGMKERNSYIATRVIGGRFIALTNKGKLYSWDMITGKLLVDDIRQDKGQFKIYKDYELYTWEDED